MNKAIIGFLAILTINSWANSPANISYRDSQGSLYLRSGYKSLFMKDSQFGPTYGGGIKINLMNNQALQLDYSRRTAGLLGDLSSYTISIGF